jgi:hypothetical protein
VNSAEMFFVLVISWKSIITFGTFKNAGMLVDITMLAKLKNKARFFLNLHQIRTYLQPD